jgi:hypothetical protein
VTHFYDPRASSSGNYDIAPETGRNVIVQTRTGDPGRVLMIGATFDSAPRPGRRSCLVNGDTIMHWSWVRGVTCVEFSLSVHARHSDWLPGPRLADHGYERSISTIFGSDHHRM